MNLEITLIPIGRVAESIPNLYTYFKGSEARGDGRFNVDDILRFVLTGCMQLWAVFSPEEQKIYGHIVTEIKQYPQFKMLVIQYCCLEPNHMAYVEDKMQDVAERFAKDSGCTGIELVGRPGWGKRISKYGYEMQSVTYQKFFKE
jgi:hypothetical protein